MLLLNINIIVVYKNTIHFFHFSHIFKQQMEIVRINDQNFQHIERLVHSSKSRIVVNSKSVNLNYFKYK